MPKKRSSTKSRIIKAAWNLFYKHGYEQTTVDEIISASKTSKGTFYHYFKGKEALLNTLSYLFDEKYEELAGIVDPDLSAYDKLLFFNHELFHMIETSVDVGLLASLYSSQLITKDNDITFVTSRSIGRAIKLCKVDSCDIKFRMPDLYFSIDLFNQLHTEIGKLWD